MAKTQDEKAAEADLKKARAATKAAQRVEAQAEQKLARARAKGTPPKPPASPAVIRQDRSER